MSSEEVAITISMSFMAMITIISIVGMYYHHKSKSKHLSDTNTESIHPLNKFRSFDDRIRKIEDRIHNLEILIEPNDDHHEKT